MKSLEQCQEVLRMYKEGYSYNLISKKLNISRSSIRSIVADPERALRKAHPDSQKISISKADLTELVKSSISIGEILSKINRSPSGNSYKVIKQLISQYGIDVSHFLGKGHGKITKANYKFNRIPTEEILVENSTYQTSKLSKRLREDKLLNYRCSHCGLGDFWNGKEITLHLDHINGVRNDHRLDNLRFLCPNCHSQTETYCGRNAKSSLARVKFRDKGINIRRNKKIERFCNDCGKKVFNAKSVRCTGCYKLSQLKTNYPSPEVLIEMIKELGYVQVGKSLGVSDNAIRKHLKSKGFSIKKK